MEKNTPQDQENKVQLQLIEVAMETLKQKFPPAKDHPIFDFKSTNDFTELLCGLCFLSLDNEATASILKDYGYKSGIVGDEVMWMIGEEIQ